MNHAIENYQPSRHETYMNPQQKKFFRDKLIAWRERLLCEGHQSLQRIRNGGEASGDLIDRSVHDKNKLFDFISRRRTEVTIRKIDAALKRIDDGTFGYCLESGEEIGIERLLAYPVATLSIEVQKFIEKMRPRPVSDDLIM